jgi:hypothetical protein
MEAALCGDRLGISGQFRETLAADRPHMRQRFGVAVEAARSRSWPLLFCGETARYYHRLSAAT